MARAPTSAVERRSEGEDERGEDERGEDERGEGRDRGDAVRRSEALSAIRFFGFRELGQTD